MADQKTINAPHGAAGNGSASVWQGSGAKPNGLDRPGAAGSADRSSVGVVTNVASFGENLLSLAELQARLTAVELRRNVDSVKSTGALMVFGAVLALSAFPVMLLGVAELLVTELGMKRGYGLLTTGFAAVLIAGACIAIASHWLRRKPLGLPLASEEFTRNMSWLRTVLRQSSRSWPLGR
jgi:Putative Actinobacterial Holin-X, holin superfamily III